LRVIDEGLISIMGSPDCGGGVLPPDLQPILDRLGQLEQTVSSLDVAVNELDIRVAALEAQTTANTAAITDLTTRVTALETAP
jgi:uncharacterized coiled-coil protein SlyX